LLILAFAVTGELFIAFNDYVFHRLGLNRNFVMTALLAAPFAAAFIAARYTKQYRVAAGLSYLVLYPAIGAAAHWVSGVLGATVDFAGGAGALRVFRLELAIGSLPVIAGTVLGVLLPSREVPTG
jgi:hypothetical protein